MSGYLHNSTILGLLLAAALLVAVALLVVAVVLLLRSRKKEAAEEVKTGQAELAKELLAGAAEMTASFREALQRMRARNPVWGYQYKAPWYVLVGEAASGKSRIADQLSGLNAGEAVSGEGEYTPRWLLLDRAVVIDLPGRSFQPSPAVAKEEGGKDVAGLPAPEFAAAQVAWKSFLRHTVRFRPREPLNGLILTVSADELLEAVSDPDHQRRMAKIVAIAQRMDEVQQATGLTLPVYVLITKCDRLPSFQAFSRMLFSQHKPGAGEPSSHQNNEYQDDLFGWSNPYSLEQEYSPAWVEEAFASLRAVLLGHQLKMLSQCRSADEADKIFLFPFHLQKLQAPLQVLLNRVFRNTALHASHRLRGIYFCGEAQAQEEKKAEGKLLGPPVRTPLLTPPALAAGRLCFMQNLFEYKIFPERFLASPVARFRGMGNRSVLAARLVACFLVILLGLGTFQAWARIANLQRQSMIPVLDLLTQSLDNIAMSSNADVKPAADLLNMLGATHESEYYSLVMPYSYLDIDGLHRNLHRTMERTFEVVILRSCQDALQRRITALMNYVPRAAAANTSTAEHMAGDAWAIDASYLELQNYLSSLKELNQNIERYGVVSGAGSGSFVQLNSLLHYLGGRGLPDDSRLAQDPYYRRLLLDAAWEGLRIPSNYDSTTATITRQLIDGFYRSWLDANPLVARVQTVAGNQGIGLFSSSQALPSNEQLRLFVGQEKALDSQLNGGAFDWIAEDFTRERYPALSGELNGISFADREFTDGIAAKGDEHLETLRTELETAPPVLETQNGEIRVAGQVRELASVLDSLLGYELMASESSGPASGNCRLLPAGTIWNHSELNKAVQMDATRAKIESDLLISLPSPYREQLRNLVRSRTSSAIFHDLQGATLAIPRTPEGDPSLDVELQNFSSSLDLLKQIGDDLTALHATAELSCLNRSQLRQANELLARVNAQLPSLYSPSVTVDTIRDGQLLSLKLYGVSSAEELETYLGTERQKIETLAGEAAPLVQWLSSAGGHSDIVTRWRMISRDVSALQAKKPGNAIQSLENYITGDLDKVTPAENCRTASLNPSNDIFLAVRTQLAQTAVSSCHQLAVAHFNAMATEFNNHLAGHFPFSTGLDLRAGAEASLSDIASFYQKYDLDSPGLAEVLPQVAANSDEALAFLKAMETARPLVSGSAALPDPALGIEVKFRANRSHEMLGDRIAGWRLEIGQRAVESSSELREMPPLTWTAGDPVRMTLRYANNAPEIPAESNPSAAAEVKESSVIYTYTDAWSILAFLRDHRPTYADTRNICQFRIPNRFATASNAANPSDTVVFLQMSLIPVGTKTGAAALPVPVFPASAPTLTLKNLSGEE